MKRTLSKLLLIAFLIGVLWFLQKIGAQNQLNLETLRNQQHSLKTFADTDPLQASLIYFALYVAITALSVPGAAILTLAGGAIFGLLHGLLLVSFASTLGASLAFLSARFLLRDFFRHRFGSRLEAINQGISRDGALYLFTLRLLPVFPFFLVNVLMGLTNLPLAKFFFVSQVGMLPGTLVFVNAGTQLGTISSVGDILSWRVLLSFVVLGAFPWLAKASLGLYQTWQVYRPFRKPKKFDYNLIVIGAGSAGLVSSYIAAAVKAKVMLIERHKMGGDCLNTGCVPSKALIRTAKLIAEAKRATDFGLQELKVRFDFKEVMERVQRVISRIEPHDSKERYEGLGVECVSGEAFLLDPWRVRVNDRVYTTRAVILATGASPFIPDIPGLRDIAFETSDTIWNLRQKPQRLIVLGGGPIGCELAQCFARLGSEVTIIERGEKLMGREDTDVAELLRQQLSAEGIRILTNHQAVRAERRGETQVLLCKSGGQNSEDDPIAVEADRLLVALGRRANTKGFGLEELGIDLSERGTIASDQYLATKYPNIFVCGDVAGPYQFTHTAAHQAWFASVNALFGSFRKFKADYRVIPWCTYTDPEIARVGLSESEAQAAGIPFEVTKFTLDELDRAITDEAAKGFVKVLTEPGKDRILGCTIVGAHAGDIIVEYVSAMKHGIGLNKILSTIHIYPTLAEANKYVAGEWRRHHSPAWALALLAKFHAWRRV